MTVKQVSIRLKPEGGADVVRAAKDAESALVGAQTKAVTATEAAIAAGERQVRQLKETATAAALAAQPTATQARINAITGVTGGGNARADVAARTLFAANDDMERRAREIRAAVDPAGAAVDRLNDELRELNALQRAGTLSATEAAKAQALARARYDETTAALNRQAGGLTRNNLASRLNLTRQASDVVVTAGMGMNPAMIALQQGPQILDALATSGFKAQGAVLLLGGALGAAAAVAGVSVAAFLSAEKAYLGLERAATGLGRASGVSASELEALSITAARAGDVSEASARRQAIAYVTTGRIGAEEIGRLIEIGKDYAAVMGLDAEEATDSLAKAMTRPDVAARDLTRSIGLLDQKTLDHIDTLVKAGRQQEAQKILLDALSDAVDGQADKIGGIESAWDAAAIAVSNYWDAAGRALLTTPQERLAQMDQRLDLFQPGPNSPGWVKDLQAERDELAFSLARETAANDRRSIEAAENQGAQGAADRAAAARRNGRGGSGDADRAAREALQRQRREEDRAAQIDMEVARARGDTDRLRALEDEGALRGRIRQLEDDGVSARDAAIRAGFEQLRIQEARADQTQRESGLLIDAANLEANRLAGMERFVRMDERRDELNARMLAYQEAGYDLASAKTAADLDQLQVDQARLDVQERIYQTAVRDRDLELARARGDRSEVRRLGGEAWTDRRAREIERTGELNYGEGDEQAAREFGDLLRAESIGATRDWASGFVNDIRNSGIRGALSEQFDSVAERFINRLVDGLFDLKIGGGKGGGNWLAKGVEFLFAGAKAGKNANGTDFWEGGPTWVGERGPELMWAPRGAAITDADRSRRLAAAGGKGGSGGGAPMSFTYAPSISVQGSGPEIDALRRELAAERAGFESNVIAAVNKGRRDRKIP